MTPSTANAKPAAPQCASPDSSSASSPAITSPRTSFSLQRTSFSFNRTSSDSSSSPRFLSRMRSSRSRSPRPRALTSNPVPEPSAQEKPLRVRTDSTMSSPPTSPTTPQFRPRTQKRNSGTTMQVGRHGNDWLFGGFSFTDAVKSMLGSADGDNGRE